MITGIKIVKWFTSWGLHVMKLDYIVTFLNRCWKILIFYFLAVHLYMIRSSSQCPIHNKCWRQASSAIRFLFTSSPAQRPKQRLTRQSHHDVTPRIVTNKHSRIWHQWETPVKVRGWKEEQVLQEEGGCWQHWRKEARNVGGRRGENTFILATGAAGSHFLR